MDRHSKTLEILSCRELLPLSVLLLQYNLIGPLSRGTIYTYPSVCPNADIHLCLRPPNVVKIIPLAYCCYWKHMFSSLICWIGLHKKNRVQSKAKMMLRYLDENRQFCSRLPNILAVLKSHLKSDEISFRKLFSMKNILLYSTYKMLMQIYWLLLLFAYRLPSCNTAIINLTVSVGWAPSLQ